MTIPLEQLADGTITDRNFQALRRLVIDTGGVTAGVRFGTADATWAGARTSTEATVTHGLGKAPVVVFVTGAQDQGTEVIAYQAYDYTDTEFTVRGDFTAGFTPTGDSSFAWVAIG